MEENKIPQEIPSAEEKIVLASDNNNGQPAKKSRKLYLTTQCIGAAALAIAIFLYVNLGTSTSPGFDQTIGIIFFVAGIAELYAGFYAKRTLMRLIDRSDITLYETHLKGRGFVGEKKGQKEVNFDYNYDDIVGVSYSNDILTIYPFARDAIMVYALNAEQLRDTIHDMSWEQRSNKNEEKKAEAAKDSAEESSEN